MDATCSVSWLNKEAWGSLMNSIHVRVADWQKDNAELRRIREAVFIAEQSVPPELEWDASVRDAIDAMHLHVVDFLLKPIDTANETRPWLQGSRLTAWELAGEGIPVTVNADSAGAHILKTKGVTWVIVGADCIAANGDVISKIGTYQLAVCAMHHGVRFMVVAPSSTLDMMMATGDDVALEERDAGELLDVMGQRLEAAAFNPVFDVTPADLIDVIVTEKGVVERPDTAKLAKLMCRKRLH